MSSYTIVKDCRKLNPEGLTVELIDAAIEEQESLVRETAVALGRASGLVYGAKKSPFPVETVTLENGKTVSAPVAAAIQAQFNFAHELERLSKLVTWREAKILGL